MIKVLWLALVGLGIWFAIVLARDIVAHRDSLEDSSWLKTSIIGFVTNFFDVLGIGAFAPQTALLKFTKQTTDKHIPGTMNVANTLPVVFQALVFITIIEVEAITMVLMFVAAALGAIYGAGVVAKLSERRIQIVMGIALLVTAFFMVATSMEWIEGGGDAIGLRNGKLAIAVIANFGLGALMTAGIGLYAPCMALVFALGMSPQVAFPIMMGSCAFLMPPASVRFIREKAYNRKAAVAMALPGIVAVGIAAFVVKSLPLDVLRWVIVLVVLYTSGVMLHAGFSKK